MQVSQGSEAAIQFVCELYATGDDLDLFVGALMSLSVNDACNRRVIDCLGNSDTLGAIQAVNEALDGPNGYVTFLKLNQELH